MGDVLEIARGITSEHTAVQSGTVAWELRILPIEELKTQYYVRLTVADRAGVMAQITKLLGDLGISIASVIQKNADATAQTAEIVVMTHPAQESAMRQALQQLDRLEVVSEVGNLIRVEQWL